MCLSGVCMGLRGRFCACVDVCVCVLQCAWGCVTYSSREGLGVHICVMVCV